MGSPALQLKPVSLSSSSLLLHPSSLDLFVSLTFFLFFPAPITLKNASSLSVLEGQSLRLLCVVHSNPPARLSWAYRIQAMSPPQPSNPGVLKLPQVESNHESEFTCQAQHPQGSLCLSVQSECTRGLGRGERRRQHPPHPQVHLASL